MASVEADIPRAGGVRHGTSHFRRRPPRSTTRTYHSWANKGPAPRATSTCCATASPCSSREARRAAERNAAPRRGEREEDGERHRVMASYQDLSHSRADHRRPDPVDGVSGPGQADPRSTSVVPAGHDHTEVNCQEVAGARRSSARPGRGRSYLRLSVMPSRGGARPAGLRSRAVRRPRTRDTIRPPPSGAGFFF